MTEAEIEPARPILSIFENFRDELDEHPIGKKLEVVKFRSPR
jgi:hypothetical protein